MSKPQKDQSYMMRDRDGKSVKCRVYKVTDTHVTLTLPDGKMWCMTVNEFDQHRMEA